MESREASTISFAPEVLSNSVGEEVLLLFLFPWFSGEESTAAAVAAAFVALSLSSSRESNIALFRVKSLLLVLVLLLLLLRLLLLLLLLLSLRPIASVFVVSVNAVVLIIAVVVIVRRPLPCRRDPGQNKVPDFANDDDDGDEACVTTTPSRDDDVLLLRAKLFPPLFFNKAAFEKEHAFAFLLAEDKDKERKEAPFIVGIDIDDIDDVSVVKNIPFNGIQMRFGYQRV